MPRKRVVRAPSTALTRAEILAANERLLLAGLREHEAAETARQDAAIKEHRALHDDLTGLPNRTLFGDRLQQAILAARREEGMAAVLLLDLNGFKLINDRFGHAAGDYALQQVAERLLGALRASDTAARLGGDEFALLLPITGGLPQAVIAGRRVLSALEEPYSIYGTPQDLKVSIGIALFPQHGAEAPRLLEQADSAMYAAKRSGGGYALAGYHADPESPLPSAPARSADPGTREALPTGPDEPMVSARAHAELRAINEQLLLAALGQHERVEQFRRAADAARQQFEEVLAQQADERHLRGQLERLTAEREVLRDQLADGIVLAEVDERAYS